MAEEKEAISKKQKEFEKEVLNDFKLACESREASLLGRKEVLTGKAKFGIFGDGKEIAQLAMAKQFQNGDFRSGYYRDQTFMMAIGQLSIKQLFAGLYAHTNVEAEPSSAGRQMGGHFSTRNLNEDGSWKDLTAQKNSSADISPTAGQMPRLLGLAQASKVYRSLESLHSYTQFSNKGNEVAFGTIGDASTSEGMFFETMNAAGVLQVPMLMSVWDDGYGISVPKKYQTTKGSISELLKGFQRNEKEAGFEIYRVKGWDYPALVNTYEKAVKICRKEHVPVLIHVEEVTQPQGHSTSGSHERYKSKELLEWSQEFDCLAQFKKWISQRDIATEEELNEIAEQARKDVKQIQKEAWTEYLSSIKQDIDEAEVLITALALISEEKQAIAGEIAKIKSDSSPTRKNLFNAIRETLRLTAGKNSEQRQRLIDWYQRAKIACHERFNSMLYSESSLRATNVEQLETNYNEDAEMVDGRIILRDNFEALFKKHPNLLTFGEDVGKIGGVNQSMEGMQEKFGPVRVSDTGIREATIVGQGIGMAMRGLRPIAEIQYLDYLLYALQIMSDDLATLQYRTKGGQKAPLIVRTRGHRLEGIWHAGSPMGTIINSIRGIIVCVPRNMAQAAGFYNRLLQGDDPALVIEPLNGYRSKEKLPSNLAEFTTPIGVPEIVQEGTDITIVSYGSTFNLAIEAAKELNEIGISAELIDVRTLLPFDVDHLIKDSVKKTSRILIVDEDVSSGASAFILDKVLNEQGAYYHLDSAPKTLSAKDHRPPYGTDGDYFSKPSIDDIFEAAYSILSESDPEKYPALM